MAEDRELVQRCLAGDAAAWERILERYARLIHGLCFRFTGRAEDAEDLTQESFLRVYRNLASYRAEQGGLHTWIASLTRHLLIDHYRRRKYDRLTDSLDARDRESQRSAFEPVAAAHRRPDAGLWRRELHEEVQRALVRLSPELREAVILRDLQEMDYKEIAALLRVPEGTVKSRLNRGRLQLARFLQPRLQGRSREVRGDNAGQKRDTQSRRCR